MIGRGKVEGVLASRYDKAIAKHVLDAYQEIESNYVLEKWKASELDAGHFVEATRRLLELELFGTYTAFDDKLSNFSDGVLKQYEQAVGHDDSYRMLIPRALKSVYNVRNKRGVGHISAISPNEMDATLILYTVKWVLAELVRLASPLTSDETQRLVDSIVERQTPLLWKTEKFIRVLNPDLVARQQILVLLYDQSPRADSDLRSIIEYKNKTNFTKILGKLHSSRLIEYRGSGECFISPSGAKIAEDLIRDRSSGT